MVAIASRSRPGEVDRASSARPGRRPRRRPWSGVPGFLFISPWFVGFVVFVLGPIIASFYLSFTDYSGLSNAQFIGLGNYHEVLKDPLFWKSVYNTFYYVGFSVAATMVAAFLVALLISSDIPGIRLFRTFFYIPVVVPSVANALLWMVLFNDAGFVNGVLHAVGLPTFSWLFDPRIAKLVFVSMSVWGLGTFAMIFVAGLRDIPVTYYEAAAVDGAGPLAKLRYITLPLMAPVIFFNVVIGVINSFQVFTAAYVITSGGPANSTLFYVLYLYSNGFRYLRMGYASALAWILFLIILIFTAIQFRLARSWVHYEGDHR